MRSFSEKYEEVSLLRDKINHIHSNIGNFSRKKSRIPPMQGFLSYAFLNVKPTVRNDVVEIEKDFFIVNMNVGSLTHDKHTGRASNPVGKNIELPVGCFTIRHRGCKTRENVQPDCPSHSRQRAPGRSPDPAQAARHQVCG